MGAGERARRAQEGQLARDEEVGWLLKARDQQIHLYLGLPTFLAYLENVLGYSPRTAQDIRGSAPDGLTFLHGDGRRSDTAPAAPEPPDGKTRADAVSALANLSFPKCRARAAVEAVAAHVGVTAPVEEIVRAALRQLRSQAGPRVNLDP